MTPLQSFLAVSGAIVWAVMLAWVFLVGCTLVGERLYPEDNHHD